MLRLIYLMFSKLVAWLVLQARSDMARGSLGRSCGSLKLALSAYDLIWRGAYDLTRHHLQ